MSKRKRAAKLFEEIVSGDPDKAANSAVVTADDYFIHITTDPHEGDAMFHVSVGRALLCGALPRAIAHVESQDREQATAVDPLTIPMDYAEAAALIPSIELPGGPAKTSEELTEEIYGLFQSVARVAEDAGWEGTRNEELADWLRKRLGGTHVESSASETVAGIHMRDLWEELQRLEESVIPNYRMPWSKWEECDRRRFTQAVERALDADNRREKLTKVREAAAAIGIDLDAEVARWR